jgi:hypothetical protein
MFGHRPKRVWCEIRGSKRAVLLGLFCSALACSGTVDQGEVGDGGAEEPEPPVLTGPIQWDPQSQMVQIASTIGCDSWTPT